MSLRGIIPAHAGFTASPAEASSAGSDHPRTRGVYAAGKFSREANTGSSPHTRGLQPLLGGEPLDPGIIPAHAGFTRPPSAASCPPRDHPRTRGVYVPATNPSGNQEGSSPHTRGLLGLEGAYGPPGGIIPAHAGFTAWPPSSPSWVWDHPRTRGVYSAEVNVKPNAQGSSPHTRGLPTQGARQPARGGIIPAHAGFTHQGHRHPVHKQDHPRTRGVYPVPGTVSPSDPGSSPHTRGLRQRGRGRPWSGGIIPAHAGFTTVWRRPRPAWRDHPRTRGVYVIRSRPGVVTAGSSPHTRGLQAAGEEALAPVGIIPAHAGFTPRRSRRQRPPADHPRTRGVYPPALRAALTNPGSSPHTRGLRPLDHAQAASPGIIPAHAGFTRTTTACSTRGRDHPRTRGVYRRHKEFSICRWGSSPHTRGLLGRRRRRRPRRRIIPAHAGFTARAWEIEQAGGDHPRTRGVYVTRSFRSRAVSGSSPHTRGLLLHDRTPLVGVGIIPAHAGFTEALRFVYADCPDHPRTRGVYLLPLSPRNQTVRIIPAHAGFTTRMAAKQPVLKDHPRTRGVYIWLAASR